MKDLPEADGLTRVDVLYFYDQGCGICQEIRDSVFPSIEKSQNVSLHVMYLDVDKNTNLRKLLYMEEKLGYSSSGFPVVFVGTNEAAGEDGIKAKISEMVAIALAHPATINRPAGLYGSYSSADKTDVRFAAEKLGVLPVMAAGLLDGVNPCAFSTLIFLIAFLAFLRFDRRRILITGVFYTLGVFLAYLGAGIGAFGALKALSAYTAVAMVIRYASIALLACVFVLSLVDIIRYLVTKKTDFILSMPDSFKKKIHENIHARLGSRSLLIGAFVLGAVIAFFELACTGQVYLPVILSILNVPELRIKAVGLLLLYNIAFILPLIAVFIAAYAGTDSGMLEKIFRKNLLLIKILLAAAFGVFLWIVTLSLF